MNRSYFVGACAGLLSELIAIAIIFALLKSGFIGREFALATWGFSASISAIRNSGRAKKAKDANPLDLLE